MNTKYTQSAVESILPSVIVRCAPKNIKQDGPRNATHYVSQYLVNCVNKF